MTVDELVFGQAKVNGKHGYSLTTVSVYTFQDMECNGPLKLIVSHSICRVALIRPG